jgi:hypothetical protein
MHVLDAADLQVPFASEMGEGRATGGKHEGVGRVGGALVVARDDGGRNKLHRKQEEEEGETVIVVNVRRNSAK